MENFNSFRQENKIDSAVEKADALVKEIIINLRENPLYAIAAEECAFELENKWELAKALALNDRSNRQIEEFIANDLAEEIFKTEELDPTDIDFLLAVAENGGRVEGSPIYGNNPNEVIDRRYYKTPTQLSPEQVAVVNNINTKYEEESHTSFARSWQAKEALFEERIKAGEMVFLGEMAFSEYIKMRIDNAPESHQIQYELTPIFDENQITWSKDNNRIYAYTGSPKVEGTSSN